MNARLFRLHSPLHRQRENHDEHAEIVQALRASALMREHLRNLQEDVKRALTN
ncbi:MAG: hypothetical protein ABIP34_14020 [Rhodoferax sp.]|uniref:hypothetical protein n=1 Tax=Rhodoferax sp. TaxID=50421 RepID=UPI0032678331